MNWGYWGFNNAFLGIFRFKKIKKIGFEYTTNYTLIFLVIKGGKNWIYYNR